MNLWRAIPVLFSLVIFSTMAEATDYSQYQCPADPNIPCIVAIGDSTVWGNAWWAPNNRALNSTPVVLQQLLANLQPQPNYLKKLGGKDLSKAVVLNLAVGGTTTVDWAVTPRNSRSVTSALLCDSFTEADYTLTPGLRLVRKACDEGGGMASKVASVVGRYPDIVLVTIGVNDYMLLNSMQSFINMVDIRSALTAPPPLRQAVLFSTPFRVDGNPGHQAFVVELQAWLAAFKMLKGPDFTKFPLATSPDGVHLQEGSYAAAAGLWLNALWVLPWW